MFSINDYRKTQRTHEVSFTITPFGTHIRQIGPKSRDPIIGQKVVGREGVRTYQQRRGHSCRASLTAGLGPVNLQAHNRNAPINSTGYQDLIELHLHHHDSGRGGHDKAEPQTWIFFDAPGPQRDVKRLISSFPNSQEQKRT